MSDTKNSAILNDLHIVDASWSKSELALILEGDLAESPDAYVLAATIETALRTSVFAEARLSAVYVAGKNCFLAKFNLEALAQKLPARSHESLSLKVIHAETNETAPLTVEPTCTFFEGMRITTKSAIVPDADENAALLRWAPSTLPASKVLYRIPAMRPLRNQAILKAFWQGFPAIHAIGSLGDDELHDRCKIGIDGTGVIAWGSKPNQALRVDNAFMVGARDEIEAPEDEEAMPRALVSHVWWREDVLAFEIQFAEESNEPEGDVNIQIALTCTNREISSWEAKPFHSIREHTWFVYVPALAMAEAFEESAIPDVKFVLRWYEDIENPHEELLTKAAMQKGFNDFVSGFCIDEDIVFLPDRSAADEFVVRVIDRKANAKKKPYAIDKKDRPEPNRSLLKTLSLGPDEFFALALANYRDPEETVEKDLEIDDSSTLLEESQEEIGNEEVDELDVTALSSRLAENEALESKDEFVTYTLLESLLERKDLAPALCLLYQRMRDDLALSLGIEEQPDAGESEDESEADVEAIPTDGMQFQYAKKKIGKELLKTFCDPAKHLAKEQGISVTEALNSHDWGTLDMLFDEYYAYLGEFEYGDGAVIYGDFTWFAPMLLTALVYREDEELAAKAINARRDRGKMSAKESSLCALVAHTFLMQHRYLEGLYDTLRDDIALALDAPWEIPSATAISYLTVLEGTKDPDASSRFYQQLVPLYRQSGNKWYLIAMAACTESMDSVRANLMRDFALVNPNIKPLWDTFRKAREVTSW